MKFSAALILTVLAVVTPSGLASRESRAGVHSRKEHLLAVTVNATAATEKAVTVSATTDNSVDVAQLRAQAAEVVIKLQTDELLGLLISYGNQSGGVPPYGEFIPACLVHLRQIVQAVDQSYTDQQLESVLLNECDLEKQFPNSAEDGFNHTQACQKFAKDLTVARHTELATGSAKGYTDFCDDYYVHKGGVIPGPQEEKPEETKLEKKPAAPPTPMVKWLLGFLTVAGIGGACFLLATKPKN